MAETTTREWEVDSQRRVDPVRTNFPKVTIHNHGPAIVGVRVDGVPLGNLPETSEDPPSKTYHLPTGQDVLVEVVFLYGPSKGLFEFEIFN